jgi:hypothetical protein
VLKVSLLMLCAASLAACQPSNPPPTPLPTKEKTIDRVNEKLDDAMKKTQERLEAIDADKKGS